MILACTPTVDDEREHFVVKESTRLSLQVIRFFKEVERSQHLVTAARDAFAEAHGLRPVPSLDNAAASITSKD